MKYGFKKTRTMILRFDGGPERISLIDVDIEREERFKFIGHILIQDLVDNERRALVHTGTPLCEVCRWR